MKILLATADGNLAALVHETLRRFRPEIVPAEDGLSAFQALVGGGFDLVVADFDLPPTDAADVLSRLDSTPGIERPPALVLVRGAEDRERLESAAPAGVEALPVPVPMRTLADRVLARLRRKPRIACIGGGTGLFTLLRGLKTLPGLELTSIVTMMDDGGSTGRLRDSFGVLPPGDVRRSLIALSRAPDLLNELLAYRFVRGGELAGHNLGNLLLTALSEMRGGMARAVAALGEILGTEGRVVPVTEEHATLHAELEDGTRVAGESRIDRGEGARIRRLWCEPEVGISDVADRAIRESDLVVLGPGDLFTSVISNLVVTGMPEAVRSASGRRAYVCNLMTEPGETREFTVQDHVRELVRHLGGDVLDDVFCSTTVFSEEAVAEYGLRGQLPVREAADDPLSSITGARIHRLDLGSDRSLLRHDSLKLARAFRPLVAGLPEPRGAAREPSGAGPRPPRSGI